MIEAICPSCETPFQVEDSLKGKTIRCPNTRCKQPFVVGLSWKDDPPPRQQTGSVGEIIPVLPASPVKKEPPPSPIRKEPPAPSWLEPPPVRVKPVEKQGPDTRQPPEPEVEKPTTPGEEAQPAPSWLEPPPVRVKPIETQDAGASPPPREPEAEKPSTRKAPPPAPSWLEPPPVRTRPNEQPAAATPPPGPAPTAAPSDQDAGKRAGQEAGPGQARPPAGPVKGTWIKRFIYGSLLLVICFLAAGAWYAWRFLHQTEEQLRAQAIAEYQAGNFVGASEKFGQLPEKFPESAHREEYEFLKQLSDLRARMHSPESPVDLTLDEVSNFVFTNRKEPLFDPYHADLGSSLVHLLDQFVRRVTPAQDESPLEVLDLAERVVRQVNELNGALTTDQQRKLREGFQEVRASVALWRKREDVVAELRNLADDPSNGSLRRARELLQREQQTLGADTRAWTLVRRMYEQQLERIKYDDTPAPPTEHANPGPDAGQVRSLWLDVPLAGVAASPLLPVDERQTSLAVVRGVLYALSGRTGEVLWAHRVGADTTALPVRVADDGVSEDRILVLSADTQTLSALDRDGHPVWSYALGAACLGKPLVVDGRAFLPTVDGVVHEVELVRGRRLGRYLLGHRLTVGGVHEPGTSRVYFPADDSAVYVIDVARNRCRGILHTGHARGSLRGEPLLLPSDRSDTPGYLLLTHVQGHDETRLSTYRLPTFDQPAEDRVLEDIPEQGVDFWLLENGQPHRIQRGWPDDPGLIRPAASVSGWTWFPPATDGEKLALVTDAGQLVLFGVRQPGNRDPLLFPWIPGADTGLALDRLGGGPDRTEEGSSRGRCQVVQLHGEDLWVLAQGVLRRIHLVITPDKGPALHAEWNRPLEVGFPFHESQMLLGRERTHDSPFVLVAQHLDSPQAVALAVNRDNADVLWKRQLGAVAAHDLVPIPSPDGKETRLVMMDHAGSLLLLSPDQSDAGKPWQHAGTQLAPGLAENPGSPPHLLPSADGRSVFQIACPGAGRTIVIRQVVWEKDKSEPQLLHNRTFDVPAPLTGTPGVMANAILLPLGDAVLHKLALPIDSKGQDRLLPTEINWRFPGQGDNIRGFVVPLGDGRLLLTDGAFSMRFYRHDADRDQFVPLPTGQPAADDESKHVLKLPFSLMTPPAVVPLEGGTGVLVGDSSGALTLFEQGADGKVTLKRQWNLGGPLTSGPYVYRPPAEPARVLVGGVVQRDRFVWIDPTSGAEPRTFDTEGEPIVGRPVWTASGKLLLATRLGRLTLVDPRAEVPEGPSWFLGGSLAPAAAPVVLGDPTGQWILQALTDGTMQLIPMSLVERPGGS